MLDLDPGILVEKFLIFLLQLFVRGQTTRFVADADGSEYFIRSYRKDLDPQDVDPFAQCGQTGLEPSPLLSCQPR